MKEFIRRIEVDGSKIQFDANGAALISGENTGAVKMAKNGDIIYHRSDERLAQRVCELRDEVNEYMRAYQTAVPDEKDSNTRTLLVYNNCELAARRMPNESIDFVTWRHGIGGEREVGNYYDDYAAAKQDFAARAGLIDRERLFSEKELAVIRSSLSEYLTLDAGERLDGSNEAAIKIVVDKIDRVIEPEINNEQEMEPEL
jgi:hypothetical protein